MDRRQISPGLVLIALAAGWLLAGCGDTGEGEFRSYSELQSQGPAANGDQTAGANGEPVEHGSPGANAASRNGAEPGAAVQPNVDATARRVVEAPQPEVPSIGHGPVDEEAADSGSEVAAVNGSSADPVTAVAPQSIDPPVEAPRPEPREITLLVPHRVFRVEGPEGAIRVSYDDIDLLKVLNMEPVPADCVAYFPEWLRDLDGRRIRIRGFMFPPFETTGIRGFVLARDNQICCFGRNPKRYDVIDVFMRDGVTTDYIQNRPFDVVGVFHIQPEDDDGELYQLYVIDDAVVIDR